MTHSKEQVIAVPIANSELHELMSSIVQQRYFVKVRLPENYYDSNDDYPVLFLLDGDHAFAMATDIVQYLVYGGNIPDLIIVSPAYGSKKGLAEGGNNRRNRDLSPYLWDEINDTADAAKFLQFIQIELIPYIESTFRIKRSDRTLAGYSLGGLFALYVLFHNSALFKNYIVVDGVHGYLIDLERNFAEQNTHLPVKLWIGAPELERPLTVKFTETLSNRHYKDFKMQFEWLSALEHFEIPAEGLTKGLLSIYRK
jgi:predicted alpha/beta superfamily hydrolase